MNSSDELAQAFRTDVVDDVEPYFWSDEEVFRYADAAYRQFVRLIGGIHDFITPAVTEVPVVAGEAIADVHPSILRFDMAHRADGREVEIVNWTDRNLMRSDDYGILRRLFMDNLPGDVQYMVVGSQRNKVKWVKVPAADDTVHLQVYRLPLAHIVDGTHSLDEVEEDHHIYLLHWMKHLAYLKRDAETYDKTASDDHRDAFIAYCAQAKAEAERYRSKVRVVQYGGL